MRWRRLQQRSQSAARLLCKAFLTRTGYSTNCDESKHLPSHTVQPHPKPWHLLPHGIYCPKAHRALMGKRWFYAGSQPSRVRRSKCSAKGGLTWGAPSPESFYSESARVVHTPRTRILHLNKHPHWIRPSFSPTAPLPHRWSSRNQPPLLLCRLRVPILLLLHRQAQSVLRLLPGLGFRLVSSNSDKRNNENSGDCHRFHRTQASHSSSIRPLPDRNAPQ